MGLIETFGKLDHGVRRVRVLIEDAAERETGEAEQGEDSVFEELHCRSRRAAGRVQATVKMGLMSRRSNDEQT